MVFLCANYKCIFVLFYPKRLLSFFASSLPFILANVTAKHVSSLMSKPQHKDGALESNGLAAIFRPFFGFCLFCIGRLLITTANLFLTKMAIPDYFDKPFTVYCFTSSLMLIPLCLHFYLAYQEFIFYTFNSYYQRFSKCLFETPEEQELEFAGAKTATINAPRQDFHDNMNELIDLTKSMTAAFGPFLLQNFSLMLLFWLLHVYLLIHNIISIFTQPAATLELYLVQIAGSILIVR